MSNLPPGTRVGAFLGVADKVVSFLGYGVYEGSEVPFDDAAGVMADALRQCSLTNPKIKLDNGDVVWGCECWWGPEANIQRQMAEYEAAGYRVDVVRIEDARRASRGDA